MLLDTEMERDDDICCYWFYDTFLLSQMVYEDEKDTAW